ncbi:endonuclease domain-containing protein [Algicola sagamiensis]|uniref:endonuclease domain-containing protein n=1 Tax=Algicola sagamiensis TaxID=163869 RepID=UPI00037E0781|nr:hypothetical protein [Algicola sagamiensis]
MSNLETALALHIRAMKLPEPQREFRFHPTRRWRFDFAWPDLKIAVEVEGGTESHGQRRTVQGRITTLKSRHLTPSGFKEDCHKYNQAALLGWRVLRFSGAMVKSGEAIEAIQQTLGSTS